VSDEKRGSNGSRRARKDLNPRKCDNVGFNPNNDDDRKAVRVPEEDGGRVGMLSVDERASNGPWSARIELNLTKIDKSRILTQQ
jgi:hypothetical protein